MRPAGNPHSPHILSPLCCKLETWPLADDLLSRFCFLQTSKAFQQHRKPRRVQQHACIRAQQSSEARKPAETAFRNTLTAFLAAGAVLMPHPSLAVSGGGGTSNAGLGCLCFSSAHLLTKLIVWQGLALLTTMRTSPTRTSKRMLTQRLNSGRPISAIQT